MPVVGHARVAERADEDRVELVAQHPVPVCGGIVTPVARK